MHHSLQRTLLLGLLAAGTVACSPRAGDTPGPSGGNGGSGSTSDVSSTGDGDSSGGVDGSGSGGDTGAAAGCVIDISVYQEDGALSSVREQRLDERGNMVSALETRYPPVEGDTIYVSKTSYAYDELDRRIETESTHGALGGDQVQDFTYYSYDATGNVATISTDLDKDGLSEVLFVVSSTYDERGLLTTEATYTPSDGVTVTSTYFYNEADLLIREVEEGPTFKNVDTSNYDERGFLVEVVADYKEDGVTDTITKLTNDELGRPLRREYDSDADGVADTVTTYSYSAGCI
jgi:hypothetical protein